MILRAKGQRPRVLLTFDDCNMAGIGRTALLEAKVVTSRLNISF